MKVALVTGITGFVGGTLVRRLHQEGWQVHGLVRASSDVEDIKRYCQIHVYDGETNTLVSQLKSIKPNIVFHVASMVLANHTLDQLTSLLEANVVFPTQLVEAMMQAEVKALINTGTSWEYYHSENYAPVNLYAATKKAFEDLLVYYHQVKGLSCITLKLFDNYGPNDKRNKLTKLLANAAKDGVTLNMTMGEQVMDITHVDDVVDAYMQASKLLLDSQHTIFQSYFVSGERFTLKEFVAEFQRVTGLMVNVNFGAKQYREREIMVPVNVQGKLLTGWTASRKFDNNFSVDK